MKLLKKIKNQGLSYHIITMILAAYFALVLNLPIYKDLAGIFSKLETVDKGFIFSIPFFFFFALTLIFSVFTWPKITKLLFSVVILVSSIVCYATFNYGIIFDVDMIQNILETNTGEASSYLSITSIVWIVGLGILPVALLVWVPIKREKVLPFFFKKMGTMVIACLGIVLIASMYYQDYVSVGRNNSYLRKLIIPTYYVHSIDKYVRNTYFSKPIPFKSIGTDAKQVADIDSNHKPTLMVIVLGETARGQNYPYNGYHRNTTPYTDKMNMVSFKDVHSCGTATAISVPCMFSRLDHADYDEQQAYHQDNLLDVLKRADVDVLWRENDGASKGIPVNVNYQNIERTDKHPLCDNSSCLDMALLQDFDKNVDDLNGNRLIVLHLIGSHGPTYFKRYPDNFAYFQPDCPRSDIENCTQEQLINSYDNTIRYTDYVVSEAINKLKSLSDKYNTGLMYLSDHGESLGEDGIYLHGMPYSLAPVYQKRVPMMVWLSPQMQQTKDIDESCLRTEAGKGGFSHDNLFDSILGVMDVSTNIYRGKTDIFAACRAHSPLTLAKN
ncbi:phosphoethanolamine--lipid A transferase [Vibrio sp.]|uniref:Phosphoethanolamine--lipid A transferase n=1 Tax=Vibrio viridaestus TaxID=2487322 RepID=A0A3N9TFA8_9VIBR|nr:phosphoethanolamine--lipid A transferase [Vibrio viridaestus]MDC0611396.1 phosphoethanolamine--lipid A transferase [Vibrio sp.]RQW62730.1 phosphoethanolamine--lipid A transferase [Vibrio viridaestus]